MKTSNSRILTGVYREALTNFDETALKEFDDV